MEWNDCEKCKDKDVCYFCPANTKEILEGFRLAVFSSNRRDLCMNNGKRLFKDKDKKD